ncbi:MAG: S8 family serine peptidase [Gemmatimonadaceae bacterium]|nr:S8 family serine peptidase [Gemmatimonadaceae bacterium]
MLTFRPTLLALASLLVACAPAAPTVTSRPEPSAAGNGNANSSGNAAPKASAPSEPDAPDGPAEAPPAWQRLDIERGGVYGTGVDRALSELLATRRPQRRVVVAVIDGGVDTAHAQLKPVLWTNPREVAGNGVDDDRNGFVDDVHGWSMIPKLPGDTGRYDTMELTRVYAACRGLPAGRGLTKPDESICGEVAKTFREKAAEGAQMGNQIAMIRGMLTTTNASLRRAMGTDTLSVTRVRAFTPATRADSNAKTMYLRLATAGIDSSAIAEAGEQLKASTWQLDTLFDPRGVPHDRAGSADVTGPDAGHGTHVAGIIGAVATAQQDVRGIAPNVSIMAIRAVPDGDERDDEVARAIRYAADNGAQIINMSFGKGYSPEKPAVDSAVRYAAAKGVLMVHAAGNDGVNTDEVPSFPSRRLAGGDDAPLWLEIGASSWQPGPALPAEFSNYGARTVDLFAPGVDINSTVPGGGVGENSGTSMAAPVVSGVAALLLSYFPTLTPEQVKGIILETVRPLRDLEVTVPGGDTTAKFGTLSRTGGVIDAYAAVKRAIEMTRPVP